MNDSAGIASSAGTLLPAMPARRHGSIHPAWKPTNRRLSAKDTLRAGAFMLCYLAAYAAAGYLGVMMVEWVWLRIFG